MGRKIITSKQPSTCRSIETTKMEPKTTFHNTKLKILSGKKLIKVNKRVGFRKIDCLVTTWKNARGRRGHTLGHKIIFLFKSHLGWLILWKHISFWLVLSKISLTASIAAVLLKSTFFVHFFSQIIIKLEFWSFVFRAVVRVLTGRVQGFSK